MATSQNGKNKLLIRKKERKFFSCAPMSTAITNVVNTHSTHNTKIP